tara:strand:- start:289 stop:444 length:156 start_codon:yes stop_codon:yes gene_type:complete
MEDFIHNDVVKTTCVSLGNFGLSLTGVHTVLQCIVAIVSIIYLIKKIRKKG